MCLKLTGAENKCFMELTETELFQELECIQINCLWLFSKKERTFKEEGKLTLLCSRERFNKQNSQLVQLYVEILLILITTR